MALTLYKTSSEKHVVSKNLTSIQAYSTYTFKDDTSMLNPVVLLNVTGVTSLSQANYMHISDFGRFYYITDIVTVHKDLVEIHGHVDVLNTYQSEISQMKAIVIRNQSLFNPYLTDNVPTFADQIVATKAFPGPFDTTKASFIVVTAGGGNS